MIIYPVKMVSRGLSIDDWFINDAAGNSICNVQSCNGGKASAEAIVHAMNLAFGCDLLQDGFQSPPSKSVRVRIAVAVNADGEWGCDGWHRNPAEGFDGKMKFGSDNSDENKAQIAASGLPYKGNKHICFVEAEIPLPQETTVQGEVK